MAAFLEKLKGNAARDADIGLSRDAFRAHSRAEIARREMAQMVPGTLERVHELRQEKYAVQMDSKILREYREKQARNASDSEALASTVQEEIKSLLASNNQKRERQNRIIQTRRSCLQFIDVTMKFQQPGETQGLKQFSSGVQIPRPPLLEPSDGMPLEDLQIYMDDSSGKNFWTMHDVVRQLKHYHQEGLTRALDTKHTKALQTSVDNLTQQVKDQKDALVKAEERADILSTDMNGVNATLTELRLERAACVTQAWHHAEVEKVVQEQRTLHNEQQSNLKLNHQAEIMRLKNAHAGQEREQEASHQSALDALRTELASAKAATANVQGQLSSLKITSQRTSEQLRTLHSKAETGDLAKNNEITRLNASLDKMSDKYEETTRANNQLVLKELQCQIDIEKMTLTVDGQKSALESWKQQFNELSLQHSKERKQWREHIAELGESKSQLEEEMSYLNGDIVPSLRSEIDQQTRVSSQAQENNRSLQEQLEAVQDLADSRGTDFAEAQSKIAELEAAAASHMLRMKETEEAKTTSDSKLEEKRLELQKAVKELGEVKYTLSTTKTSEDSLGKLFDEQKVTLEAAAEEVRSLKEDLATSKLSDQTHRNAEENAQTRTSTLFNAAGPVIGCTLPKMISLENICNGMARMSTVTSLELHSPRPTEDCLDWDLTSVPLDQVQHDLIEPNLAQKLWVHTCVSDTTKRVLALVEIMSHALKHNELAFEQPLASQMILTAGTNLAGRLQGADDATRDDLCLATLRTFELAARLTVSWQVRVVKDALRNVAQAYSGLAMPTLLHCLHQWLLQLVSDPPQQQNLLEMLKDMQLDSIVDVTGQRTLFAGQGAAILVSWAHNRIVACPWSSLQYAQDIQALSQECCAVITFADAHRFGTKPLRMQLDDKDVQAWTARYLSEQVSELYARQARERQARREQLAAR